MNKEAVPDWELAPNEGHIANATFVAFVLMEEGLVVFSEGLAIYRYPERMPDLPVAILFAALTCAAIAITDVCIRTQVHGLPWRELEPSGKAKRVLGALVIAFIVFAAACAYVPVNSQGFFALSARLAAVFGLVGLFIAELAEESPEKSWPLPEDPSDDEERDDVDVCDDDAQDDAVE